MQACGSPLRLTRPDREKAEGPPACASGPSWFCTLRQTPVTGTSVTVPTELPLMVSWPPGLTSIVTGVPADAAAPSTSATLLCSAGELGFTPVVSTTMLQGFTTMVCPTESRWPAGNVDAVIWKWHEPNVVTPVAVLPPEAMENAGVVDVLVNVSVVDAVVPKSVTPAGKENGTAVTAVVVVPVAATVVGAATTSVGAGSPPPPPHAVRLAATTSANTDARVLFIGGSFSEGGTAELFRLQQHVSNVKKIAAAAALSR
jgi:hypothetical protein